MPELTSNTVSGEETTGQQETPKPVIGSENSQASSTSELSPEMVSALSKALTPNIEDIVKRAVQSTKDKRFSDLEKNASAMQKVLTLLNDNGVQIPPAVAQNLRMSELEDAINEIRSGNQRQDTGMSGQQVNQEGGFDAQQYVRDLGLDFNDPDVLGLLSGRYANQYHFEAEASKLALRKAKPVEVTDTVLQPLEGQTQSTKVTPAQLLAAYQKEVAPHRGDIAAVSAIQAKYRKAGLQV